MVALIAWFGGHFFSSKPAMAGQDFLTVPSPWLLLFCLPLSHLKILWLYWGPHDNPEWPPYFKVTWLTTLTLSANLIARYFVI
jgi:hypothetical protein